MVVMKYLGCSKDGLDQKQVDGGRSSSLNLYSRNSRVVIYSLFRLPFCSI